jgi:hypothetical protein
MEKVNKIIRKMTKNISGGVFGLLSISFGLAGDIISYVFFPGYDFTKKAVSYLCEGPAGIFFQIGSVISGIFAILFVISLAQSFNNKQINERLKKTTLIFALISCICLVFLGAFCGSNPIIAVIHGISAFLSWSSGLIYITLFNVLILKDSKFNRYLAYSGFIISFLLLLLLIFWILHFFEITRYLYLILPTLEWVDTFAIIIWYLIVSIYLIHKKI